jgi:hypothetical protein
MNYSAAVDEPVPSKWRSISVGASLALFASIVWASVPAILELEFPGKSASFIGIAWAYAAPPLYIAYRFRDAIRESFRNVHRNIASISAPDMLGLAAAGAAFAGGLSDRLHWKLWITSLPGIAIWALGVLVACNQLTMRSSLLELQRIKSRSRIASAIKRGLLFLFSFAEDRSSLVAVYVAMTALMFVIPEELPSGYFDFTVLAVVVAFGFYRGWIRRIRRRKKNEKSRSHLLRLSGRPATRRIARHLVIRRVTTVEAASPAIKVLDLALVAVVIFVLVRELKRLLTQSATPAKEFP